MAVDKGRTLYDAYYMLNQQNQPFFVSIEGDSIVARWKVMEPLWFDPRTISDGERTFTFTCTLNDKGKYKEIDTDKQSAKGVSFDSGKVTFGASSSSFKGHKADKSFSFGTAVDPVTGGLTMATSRFDTNLVKNAIRGFLAQYGWEKAGLFG
jgi:hypothetical protein